MWGLIRAVLLSWRLPVWCRGGLLTIWSSGRLLLPVGCRRGSVGGLLGWGCAILRGRRSVGYLLMRRRSVRGLLRSSVLLGGRCAIGSLGGSTIWLLWRRTVGLRRRRLSIPLRRWLLVVLALRRRGAVRLLRRRLLVIAPLLGRRF